MITPRERHHEWVLRQAEHGWRYGREANLHINVKTHPALCPFDRLSPADRAVVLANPLGAPDLVAEADDLIDALGASSSVVEAGPPRPSAEHVALQAAYDALARGICAVCDCATPQDGVEEVRLQGAVEFADGKRIIGWKGALCRAHRGEGGSISISGGVAGMNRADYERMIHPVEVEREEDGRIIAEVPAVPGAMAYGTTEAEAAAKATAIAEEVTKP